MTDFGKRIDPEEEYKRLMGEEALERQRKLALERYACCNALKSQGHVPLCASHPARKWGGR